MPSKDGRKRSRRGRTRNYPRQVSFLCSLAAGKNSVQRIGDVFTRGAKAPDERLPISALQHRRASSESADAVERRRRRDAARPPSDEDRYGFAPKPE